MGLGQVSIEQLILVGLALGLLIPAIYFFNLYNQQSQVETVSRQVNNIGLDMVSTVESTYALGKNARQKLSVAYPDNVRRVYLRTPSELVIEYETGAGRTDAVFFSQINMTSPDANVSSVNPGVMEYLFVSDGRNVSIREVS